MDQKTQHLISISDADWEGLQAVCTGTGRRPNEVVVQLIRNYVARFSSEVGIRTVDENGVTHEQILSQSDLYQTRLIDVLPRDSASFEIFIRTSNNAFEDVAKDLFIIDALAIMTYPEFWGHLEDAMSFQSIMRKMERCGFSKTERVGRYSPATREFIHWLQENYEVRKVIKGKTRYLQGIRRRPLR